MRIRKHSRIVALALALVMILPLISIPTFAEDAVETPAYSYSENFDKAASVGEVAARKPALTTLENGALRVENTAYDDGKYYAQKTNNDKTEITVTSIDAVTGNLTGTVTLGGVLYNITGPVNTTKTKTAATLTKADDETAYTGDPVYINDALLTDAWMGNGHVATQLTLKTPEVSPTDYTKLYISVDYYVSEDATPMGHEITWPTLASSRNTRLDLALLEIMPGGYVQFNAHGNQDSVRDGANTIRVPKGTWINVFVTLDLTNGEAMLQVNGDYVRTIYDSDLTSGLKVNEFCVLQPSRGKTPNDPSTMKGYILVDNVSVSSVAPDVLYSNDFDQYAALTSADIKEGGNYNTNFYGVFASKAGLASDAGNTYLEYGFGADPIIGSERDTPLYAYTDSYATWGNNAALKAAGASAYNAETGILTVGGTEYTVTPASEANIALGFYGTFSDGGTTWKLTTGAYASETRFGDNNVDKYTSLFVPPLSYEDFDKIYISVDYYITPGSTGKSSYQLLKMAGAERNLGSIDLSSGSVGAGGASLPVGEWATLTVEINMLTGATTYYVDGTKTGNGSTSLGANVLFAQSADAPYNSAVLHVMKHAKQAGSGSICADNVRITRTLPTFDTKYFARQNFEGFANGANPSGAFGKLDHSGTTVSDEKGSKAWKIDFNNVGTAGSASDTGDLNVDKNTFAVISPASYADTKSVVLEAKYYVESGSIGRFQSQIHPIKYNSGSGSRNWVSIYQIAFESTSKNYMFLTTESGSTEYARMAFDRWNTVSTVIDLTNGDTEVYVNGYIALTFNIANYYGLGEATNFSFDANKWIVGKVNKYLGSGTFYVDDIRAYEGDAPAYVADPYATETFEGFNAVHGERPSDIDLLAIPALLTYYKEGNGNTALRLDMGASTSPDTWALIRSDTNRAMWDVERFDVDKDGDGEADYEAVTYNGKDYPIEYDDYTKEDGDVDDCVGVEYFDVLDADENFVERWWVLPGDLAEAVYNRGNVGSATSVRPVALSHSDFKNAVLEADYFIEENSTGIIESQFQSYTYDKDGQEAGGGWLQIFHLYLNARDDKKAGQLDGQGGTNYGVCAKIGEWNKIQVIVDLETGVFKVYLNGVLARVYDCGHDNITIPSAWSIAKVQRSNNPMTPVYEGGVLIDNVRVSYEDLPTSTFEAAPNWFLSEEAFNWYTEDLITQVEGASIRLSTPAGLRFASYVDGKKVEYLERAFGDKVTKGTLIAPENYVAAAGDATRTALDALKAEHNLTNAYIDVKFDGVYFIGDASLNVGDNKCMAGSIVKILATNITREFAGFGYIEIEGVASFYADASIRSVQDVAIAARAAHDQAFEADGVGLYDTDELAIIDTYAAGEWIDFGEN